MTHTETQTQLTAIVVAMEAMSPGSTHNRRTGIQYRAPRQVNARRVYYLDIGGNGQPDGFEVVEGSWLPEEGAISDGMGRVPPNESPADTARRLFYEAEHSSC